MKKPTITFQKKQMIILEKANYLTIPYNQIIGVFREHPYIKLVTVNEKPMLFYHGLKELSLHLPFPLVLCSQSAIVNLEHIANISNCIVELNTGQTILISRRHKSSFLIQLKRYAQQDSTGL